MPAAYAQDDSGRPTRTVSVSGEGTVNAEPDMAVVRLAVVTEAMEAAAAREQNGQAASRAMNAVRDLGIPENKIRMETLRLQPKREYNRETRTYEEKGYEATRQVVVEVEDLEQLPQLIADVVEQGANRLDGVSYELSDRDAVRNEALQEAARNARQKAELLAQALGAEVGAVQTINEQSISFPRPFATFDARAVKAETAEASPDAYAAGELEVSANVQVVFALTGGE